jgi:cytoskeletal protein CcmA (bactofilin family)
MAQATKSTKRNAGGAGVIGASTRVRGRVAGDGDLTVLGELEGDVLLRGSFTVGEGGVVVSNVEAHDVSIDGRLEGDVSASGAIHLGGRGGLKGNVKGARFSMDDGAEFSGFVECDFDMPAELSGGGSGKRGRG